MASTTLQVEDMVCVLPQLTLGDGPEVLNRFTWTPKSRGVVSGTLRDPQDHTHAIVVLHQARNDIHWDMGRMDGAPAEDVKELNDINSELATDLSCW